MAIRLSTKRLAHAFIMHSVSAHVVAQCRFDGPSALSVVEALLAGGANVKAINKDGMTALHGACHAGLTAVVKCLVAAGAIVNSVAPRSRGTGVGYGATPLQRARGCQDAQRLEIVKFLLENGADVNVLDEFQDSALSLIASTEDVKSVAVLLDYGANPDQTGQDGDNALSLSVRRNNKALGVLLLQYGAQLDLLSDQTRETMIPAWAVPATARRKPSKQAGQPPAAARSPPAQRTPPSKPLPPPSPPTAQRARPAVPVAAVERVTPPKRANVDAMAALLTASLEIFSSSGDDATSAIVELLKSNTTFIGQLDELARLCRTNEDQ